MRKLLTATAAIEAGAGLALLLSPSVAVCLVLGASLDTSVALIVARLGAIALLTLGISCWLARTDAGSIAAAGLSAGMLFYNSAAVVLFVAASIGYGLAGILLWPAVILHAAMAVWCIICFRNVMTKADKR